MGERMYRCLLRRTECDSFYNYVFVATAVLDGMTFLVFLRGIDPCDGDSYSKNIRIAAPTDAGIANLFFWLPACREGAPAAFVFLN